MDAQGMLTGYIKFVWPVHRMLVKSPRRCTKCVSSEDCVTIGQDGVCAECRDFAPSEATKPVKLTGIPSSRAEYDATLLLSGGKDSAYILHRMRREYPHIRILAVCVNNGFMSKWAMKNAQLAAEKTSTNLLITSAYTQRCRDALAKAFRSLGGRGCYGVVDFADGNEIFDIAREITRSLGVGTMISGLSWVQLKRILGIEKHFIHRSGLMELFPLAAWATDEQEVRRYVRDYGLVHYGSDDPLASNSLLIPSMIALDIKNLGYSSFEPEMAQLVREGKSSRDVWVSVFDFARYAVKKGWLDKELSDRMSELGLSVEDVL